MGPVGSLILEPANFVNNSLFTKNPVPMENPEQDLSIGTGLN